MKYTSAGALLLRRCVVVLFVAALASGYSNFDAKGPVFNPLDFGAVGDGVHNDTAALQSAIDACSAAKGLVFLPSDHIFRTGSLLLRSDVTLFISSGSTLLGSPVHTDYPLRWRGHYGIGPRALLTSGLCLRRAPNATGGNNGCLEWDIVRNVTIEGGGTIDGSGPSWWFDPGPSNNRMDMIEPWNVDGLTIQDIKLQRSPAWTVHPVMCSNVLVRNISLDAKIEFNDVEYDGHNVDGVDPENCVNVTIENSVIRAGDDCIAIYSMQAPPAQATHNVSVRNVVCYTPLTITHGHDTHDVTFENCTVKGRWGHSSSPLWWPQWFHTGMRLKTGSSLGSTGGTIHDILYKNIILEDVHLAIDFQHFYPCQNTSGMENYNYCTSLEPQQDLSLPNWFNLRWENISGTAWRAGWMNCAATSPCRNVSLAAVHLKPLSVPKGQFSAVAPYICANVNGTSEAGTVVPSADSCLSSANTSHWASSQQ